MARYSTFKYNSATKYGAGSEQTLLYAFKVDWNDDGAYESAPLNNDAFERMLGWSSKRGRSRYLRDSDQGGFEP